MIINNTTNTSSKYVADIRQSLHLAFGTVFGMRHLSENTDNLQETF